MTAPGAAPGPLDGIRIVEFDAIGPVPLAGMLLADMGADVVRIGRPGQSGAVSGALGARVLHRSRSTIPLDLKTECVQALDLITRADALIEGSRPGVMERLGLGPDSCLAANPRLVYGRMTGWGQTGPLAPTAGHDLNYIAVTGVLHAVGPAGAPPPVPLNLIGDYGGGAMFLVTGLLAGLLSAKATGQGQVVDAAMTDGTVALTAMFHAFRANGRWSDAREDNLLDGAAPFYRCYACADGKYVAVGALEPAFYAQLLAGLKLEAADYAQADRARWPAMAHDFAATFATRPRDTWAAIFEGSDACLAPVLDWAEAAAYPHNVARGTFVERDGMTQPAPAPRFSNTPAAIRAEREGAGDIAATLARWSAG